MPGFLDIAGAVLLGGSLISGVIKKGKADDAADAIANQAGLTAAQAAKLAEFQLEMANREADLMIAAGKDAQEIAVFNAALSRENADWEERAGAIAMDQAASRWTAQVGRVTTGLATSGFRLDESANAVIAEQVGEMQKDLLNIGATTGLRVRRANQQAELFEKGGAQSVKAAQDRAAAIRRAGEIEAETTRTTGQLSAMGLTARAAATRAGGWDALLGAGLAIAGGWNSKNSVIRGAVS